LKKPAFALAILAALILAAFPVQARGAELEAAAFGDIGLYVVEANTNTPLASLNEEQPFEPASITKILTILTAMEVFGPADTITFGQDMKDTVLADSSLADLVVGETLDFEEMCYAMLLPSGNDAARAMGIAAARKAHPEKNLSAPDAIDAFAEMMNEKAAELGMGSSHFTNPDGYPEYGMTSTAKDLVALGIKALKTPEIAEVVKTAQKTVTTNLKTHKWVNTNILIQPSYDVYRYSDEKGANPYYDADVIGMKTGSGSDAGGRCLLFAASKGDKLIVGATMHLTKAMQQTIWSVASTAIAYSDANYEIASLLSDETREVKLWVINRAFFEGFRIQLEAEGEAVACIPKEDLDRVEYTLALEPTAAVFSGSSGGRLRLKEEVAAGQTVAYGLYSIDGAVVAKVSYVCPDGYDKANLGDYAIGTGVCTLAISLLLRKASPRKAA